MRDLKKFGAMLPALLLAGAAAATEHRLEAYNTYLHAPFVQADQGGLTDILLAFLNRELDGAYHFVLVNLPRKRFQIVQLAGDDKLRGLGMLLVPEFVGDSERSRYLWSDPVFEDHNVLVFRRGQTPRGDETAQLKGLRFIGVSGNRYARYDELAATGVIRKAENNSELSNLHMVASERADFTQMNSLLYSTLIHKGRFAQELIAVPDPATPAFIRRILVPSTHAALLPRINHALAHLPCHAPWRTAALAHQIALAPCAVKP